MKQLLLVAFGFLFCTALASTPDDEINYTEGFVTGSVAVKSINSLAFGPQGILFIGDSKSAAIFAIETKDTGSKSAAVDVKNIDKKLAASLGTTVENISIQDMVVHPETKTVYIAVHNADGTPALVKLEGDQFVPVKLDNIRYSSVGLSNVVATDAKDSRDRPLRVWTISDLGYYNNQVMVTGLSNLEFSSTFRSIPFPFKDAQDQASLEIYHASHGQYETNSPVKTFTATELDGKSYLIASYTCTPLVVFPMDELKSGKHVKGRTVAELGNRNTPLDIVTMTKDGKKYLLLANSNRALMKISYDNLASFNESLSKPVEGTEGVEFMALPYVNVLQLDKLDDENFVMLQRKADGNLDLMTVSTQRL